MLNGRYSGYSTISSRLHRGDPQLAQQASPSTGVSWRSSELTSMEFTDRMLTPTAQCPAPTPLGAYTV